MRECNLPAIVQCRPTLVEDPLRSTYPLVGDNRVAIGATNLQGAYFDKNNLFAWPKTRKPEGTIGYGIFVYYLNP